MSKSETMISLQWSQFDSFILKGLKEIFACTEVFADVTLVCADGRAFKAHKLVLSMWSPYFREIFLNNVCDHPVIILRDTKSEDIQVILAFMYEGQALLRPENETRILETAVSLQIAGFSQMKEPTTQQTISSSTPTGSSSQNLSLSTRTTYGTQMGKVAQQPRHTIIGISPIQIPTAMEESRDKNIIETPATPVRGLQSSATSTTPVYKPHKRQKIELTPTKSPAPSPSKTRVAEDEQQNLTTMYSMDQQRIIITEQEIPRCSSSTQELEFIEIINISPGQNSVTLTELETAPPLEPVDTEASYIFGSTSPSDHTLPHAQIVSPAEVLLSPGSSTNHRAAVRQPQQETGKNGNNKSKNLNNRKSTSTSTGNFVPCPKCGKNVKETSLRVHLSRTHLEEGTILICPICSKPIHSRGVYYKHMFLHRKKDKKSADKHGQPN